MLQETLGSLVGLIAFDAAPPPVGGRLSDRMGGEDITLEQTLARLCGTMPNAGGRRSRISPETCCGDLESLRFQLELVLLKFRRKMAAG